MQLEAHKHGEIGYWKEHYMEESNVLRKSYELLNKNKG